MARWLPSCARLLAVLLLLRGEGAHARQPSPTSLVGTTGAVYGLLDRVLQGHPHPLRLKLVPSSPFLFFRLQDSSDGTIDVVASTASELSAGVGWYLRHYCNMTLGWPAGGGSRIVFPTSDDVETMGSSWPAIGPTPLLRRRVVPWSYFMNVCTHSYSLVWYNEADWEVFIDWLALTGINLILAMTGQEQVQYDTFRQLGLEDADIRSWFNGPAFLTWSRGQNEYGAGIGGPLPKSWMKDQYNLQRDFILPRIRSLGIVGQLPGFQGNVPVQLKDLYKDKNMTKAGATGWMDSLDPFYGEIADAYMQNLLNAFGTDHWYQLDGYFDGATAPWMLATESVAMNRHENLNDDELPLSHNPDWFLRGSAAYQGLFRSDPDAVWSFQGFSFFNWEKPEQAEALKGFIDAVPFGKFVIIDMGINSLGEWSKWNNASFFGAPFVWTALQNFGGTDGIRGNMKRLLPIPFEIQQSSSIVGLGGTPEGFNQNPAYYEYLFDSNFREGPVQDLSRYMISRSLKRYGLLPSNDKATASIIDHISQSWSLVSESLYSADLSIQDPTGVAHLKPGAPGLFEDDHVTPKPMMCQVFEAWEHMIHAIGEASSFAETIFKILKENNEPFRYDLVNLGREVLSQLSTATTLNFTDATSRHILDLDELNAKGSFHIELLHDLDTLVATDCAFLLGPWIESARSWGKKNTDDCYSDILESTDCAHFYEWNARSQITTWNPTPKDSPKVIGGPLDYAAKHWSGLIKDYYARRATILLGQALHDQAEGQALNQTAVDRLFAQHAYEWTTATDPYPQTVTGDAFAVSMDMYDKYKGWFSACSTSGTLADTAATTLK